MILLCFKYTIEEDKLIERQGQKGMYPTYNLYSSYTNSIVYEVFMNLIHERNIWKI